MRRMLLTIKYFGKRYPRLKWLRPLGPISACVVAIIAVVAGDLQNRGIKIVGHIPAGAGWLFLLRDRGVGQQSCWVDICKKH